MLVIWLYLFILWGVSLSFFPPDPLFLEDWRGAIQVIVRKKNILLFSLVEMECVIFLLDRINWVPWFQSKEGIAKRRLNISTCMLTWGLGKLHNRSDLSTSVFRNDNLNVTPGMVSLDFSQWVKNHCKQLFLIGNLCIFSTLPLLHFWICFYMPLYCYALFAFFSYSLYAAFSSLHLHPCFHGLPVPRISCQLVYWILQRLLTIMGFYFL